MSFIFKCLFRGAVRLVLCTSAVLLILCPQTSADLSMTEVLSLVSPGVISTILASWMMWSVLVSVTSTTFQEKPRRERRKCPPHMYCENTYY
jgi:hypothetical protein